VIIDGVREVVGGQPRLLVTALQDDHVVAVVIHGQLAADGVSETHPHPGDPGRTEPDHVRRPGRQPFGHPLRIGIAPAGPLPVVPGQGARGPLPGGDLLELRPGREAQVRLVPAQQLADVGQVDLGPRRLRVRRVAAGPVVFVRGDGEICERLGELRGGTLFDPGLVGVLQADQVDAAGVPGHIRVDGRRVHAADVQEARRARREPGDLRSFRQVAGRVTQLPVLGLGQVSGKERIDDLWAQHGRTAPNEVWSRPLVAYCRPLIGLTVAVSIFAERRRAFSPRASSRSRPCRASSRHRRVYTIRIRSSNSRS
jgi:hypothetical protein